MPPTQTISKNASSVRRSKRAQKCWFPVRVCWDTDRLGLSFSEIEGVLMIRTILRGSWASEVRLRKGDELVSINGDPVSKMQEHDCFEILQRHRPLRLLFARLCYKNATPKLKRPNRIAVRLDEALLYSQQQGVRRPTLETQDCIHRMLQDTVQAFAQQEAGEALGEVTTTGEADGLDTEVDGQEDIPPGLEQTDSPAENAPGLHGTQEQLGSTVLSDEYEGDEWDDFEPEEDDPDPQAEISADADRVINADPPALQVGEPSALDPAHEAPADEQADPDPAVEPDESTGEVSPVATVARSTAPPSTAVTDHYDSYEEEDWDEEFEPEAPAQPEAAAEHEDSPDPAVRAEGDEASAEVANPEGEANLAPGPDAQFQSGGPSQGEAKPAEPAGPADSSPVEHTEDQEHVGSFSEPYDGDWDDFEPEDSYANSFETAPGDGEDAAVVDQSLNEGPVDLSPASENGSGAPSAAATESVHSDGPDATLDEPRAAAGPAPKPIHAEAAEGTSVKPEDLQEDQQEEVQVQVDPEPGVDVHQVSSGLGMGPEVAEPPDPAEAAASPTAQSLQDRQGSMVTSDQYEDDFDDDFEDDFEPEDSAEQADEQEEEEETEEDAAEGVEDSGANNRVEDGVEDAVTEATTGRSGGGASPSAGGNETAYEEQYEESFESEEETRVGDQTQGQPSPTTASEWSGTA